MSIMFNIQLGLDLQTIVYDVEDLQELIKELKELEWFYCRSFDGSDMAINSNYGKNITSISKVTGENETTKTDETPAEIH